MSSFGDIMQLFRIRKELGMYVPPSATAMMQTTPLGDQSPLELMVKHGLATRKNKRRHKGNEKQ